MPLSKTKGNMYDWVTHKHTHIGGECPHQCVYCSSQCSPWPVVQKRYSGSLDLIEKELLINYGSGKTIFIEHLTDLFVYAVPNDWIERIIEHCKRYPKNTYVFQTKNPARYLPFRRELMRMHCMLGTTIETNRDMRGISTAPLAPSRAEAIAAMGHYFKTFITIEPIMDFDVDMFTEMIATARPDFVNIGADSKNKNLPEPSWEKIEKFIGLLEGKGIEVRRKPELNRIRRSTMSAAQLRDEDSKAEELGE